MEGDLEDALPDLALVKSIRSAARRFVISGFSAQAGVILTASSGARTARNSGACVRLKDIIF
jgi:hypothetical protein